MNDITTLMAFGFVAVIAICGLIIIIDAATE